MVGFDRIAWFYDPLARLVFGNRLMNAQLHLLHYLKPDSRVLILGGGTGQILERLLERQPDSQLTYIDASISMVRRAQQRHLPGSVQFIHGDENSIPAQTYDAVITPFYLDVFPEAELPAVIRRISASMTPHAQWIVAEFHPSKRPWDQFLLFTMYAFFRITTGIKAKSLPDWKCALEQNGWAESESQSDGFIGSAVFKRQR